MAEIITHNDRPAVYLADHRGRKRLYLLRIEVDGKTTRYHLEKTGDIDDPEYVVTRTPGSWKCNCKAFAYSRGLVKSCKHVDCCRTTAAFLAALAPAPA